MNKTYAKYLSVLRAFVQETAPERLEKDDIKEIYRLAGIHSTTGVFSYVYMAHPELADPDYLPAFRGECLRTLAVFTDRGEAAKHLIRSLSENGIDCIIFKGFVIRDYYPVPELRTYGDVDLIIRPEDREKCHRLMLSLGYECTEDWEPVYSYVKGTEYYEIHTDVMQIDVSDKADYKGYFRRMWEYVKPADAAIYRTLGKPCEEKTASGNLPAGTVYEFTPEYHFIYLLTHIARHICTAGAGVRMYLDLAFFLRHFGDAPDWSWVEKELKSLHLDDFANVAFTAVRDWFGVESPLTLRPVDAEVMDDFADYTVEGGVFGKNGRDSGVVFLKQNNPGEKESSRLGTLLYHMFPPISTMENRFSYLKKHRWLLPFAWVHRLIVSRKEWGRFAGSAKEIMTADRDEVARLKKIYKEIGL